MNANPTFSIDAIGTVTPVYTASIFSQVTGVVTAVGTMVNPYIEYYADNLPARRLGVFGISAAATGKTRNMLDMLSLLATTPWLSFNPLALMNEIERLKAEGYSNVEIGKKLDIADDTVGGYIALKTAGEERLLDAAINGKIPLGVAMDIARADSRELQRELLKAYESKELNQSAIRTVRRLVDQRRFIGKERDTDADKKKSQTNAESVINTFKRESQKQKLMVKKARLCDAKLVIIVTAVGKLLGDENFFNLLRAESLADIPQYLQDKLAGMKREAT